MKTMKISDPGSYAAYDPKQRARQTGLEALPHVPNSDEANGFEAMILQEFLEKSKSQKEKVDQIGSSSGLHQPLINKAIENLHAFWV